MEEKNNDINTAKEVEKARKELLDIINELYEMLNRDNTIRQDEREGIEYDFSNMINSLETELKKGTINRFKATCQLLKTSSYYFIENNIKKFNKLEELVEKLDEFI